MGPGRGAGPFPLTAGEPDPYFSVVSLTERGFVRHCHDQGARSELKPVGTDISVGLALGGGGARGIAHIHALAAFDELGIRPRMIAGTSIGAIMAAAYAAGMTARDIRDHAHQRLLARWALAGELFKATRIDRKSGSAMQEGRIRRRFNLLRLLDSLLPGDFPARFEELDIPVKVVATDFFAKAEKIFDTGPILPALAASAAAPLIFRPVTLDGTVYIDGGATNPVPFDLLNGQVDVIVAIDVIGDNVTRSTAPVGRIDVLTASSHIMQRAIVNAKRSVSEPDILLRPEIDGVRVHGFLRIEEILKRSAPFKDLLKDRMIAAMERAAKR